MKYHCIYVCVFFIFLVAWSLLADDIFAFVLPGVREIETGILTESKINHKVLPEHLMKGSELWQGNTVNHSDVFICNNQNKKCLDTPNLAVGEKTLAYSGKYKLNLYVQEKCISLVSSACRGTWIFIVHLFLKKWENNKRF